MKERKRLKCEREEKEEVEMRQRRKGRVTNEEDNKGSTFNS